jgi:hypothetical protein
MYKKAIEMYGTELMNPTIQEFLSHRAPAAADSAHWGPESKIPNLAGNDRFAPLEPKSVVVSVKY